MNDTYEKMHGADIGRLAIRKVCKWTNQRGCDDNWDIWCDQDGKRQIIGQFEPGSTVDDALKVYKHLDGPYELTIEENKAQGFDWFVMIERYQPKPEKYFIGKHDNIAHALCQAMLLAMDAEDKPET